MRLRLIGFYGFCIFILHIIEYLYTFTSSGGQKSEIRRSNERLVNMCLRQYHDFKHHRLLRAIHCSAFYNNLPHASSLTVGLYGQALCMCITPHVVEN